jgi:hypothetical protein
MNRSIHERDTIEWEHAFEDLRLADVANGLTSLHRPPPRGASTARVAAIFTALRRNWRRFARARDVTRAASRLMNANWS